MESKPNFINPNAEFSYIGSGRRFDVYDLGDFVAKGLKHPAREGNIQDLTHNFQQQYGQLQQYLGDYLVSTDFIIGEQDEIPSVFMIQADTHGTPISSLSKNELRTPYVIDFFRRSLKLYEETGHMPDIFGRPHFLRWYTHPQKTPNVVISERDNLPFPQLVDVLFTRYSLKPIIGKPHNRLLAEGTKRLLRSLL